MRDSSEKDAPGTTQWGASDALLLEGLSGLDQRFAKSERPVAVEEPAESQAEAVSAPAREVAAGSASFRSARELRAAQERVAALQRSAVRRRDGVTQALGLSPAPESDQDEVKPTPAPQVVKEREVSVVRPENLRSAAIASPAKLIPKPATAANEVIAEPEIIREPVPQQRERIAPKPRPAQELGVESQPQVDEVPDRMIRPQMEPTVRRRRTTSSFLPSVLTSFFLTSLVWGAILFTAWKFIGEEWFANLVRDEASALNEQSQPGERQLGEDLRNVQEELTSFRARHQRFVTMNAIGASLYSDSSRHQYDNLVEIGERLETGSAEEDFFQRTKERIEQAYINRIGQHKGLDTKKLFPELGSRAEARVSKDKLIRFIGDQKGSGWDRARAAYLLRRHKGDAVIGQLVQTIRDDEDLQVVFVAWDSLLILTGYDPGSKGFQPADFDRWWSTRRS